MVYLNEQMKASKELGDGEDGSNEYTEIEKKINEVKLSKKQEKALNEFKKLKSMSPMSAETSIRNYLEVIRHSVESFQKKLTIYQC